MTKNNSLFFAKKMKKYQCTLLILYIKGQRRRHKSAIRGNTAGFHASKSGRRKFGARNVEKKDRSGLATPGKPVCLAM